MASLPIPAEARERVVQAAAELYEEGGRQDFPTVDQVRRLARVDMNAASVIMREWRRAQTAQAAPVAVTVPEAVAQANNAALAALWQQAQELANTSLRTAQAAWEVERGELDAMRQELANAYEQQASELEQVRGVAVIAERTQQEALQQAGQELAAVRGELAQALTRVERAEAKAGEIEHRAADLRAELERAQQEVDRGRAAQMAALDELHQVRGELVRVQATAETQGAAHQEQRKTMAQEAARQAERFTKAQGERDEAQRAAAVARERAAELGGRLEAVQAHNAQLLTRVAPQMSTDSGGVKPKPKD